VSSELSGIREEDADPLLPYSELTAALKNPTSPRSASGTDDLSRVETELTQYARLFLDFSSYR